MITRLDNILSDMENRGQKYMDNFPRPKIEAMQKSCDVLIIKMENVKSVVKQKRMTSIEKKSQRTCNEKCKTTKGLQCDSQ